MNKFKELKQYLNNQQVVQKYLGLPEKKTSTGIWYKSPFRQERTASFCVSNRGIHDFGDSTHYDIISFVEKYFNVTPNQAVDILCNDFGLSLNNPYRSQTVVNILKQKREEENKAKEIIETWFDNKFKNVSDELKNTRRLIDVLKNTTFFDALSVLYMQEVKQEMLFEKLFDISQDEEKKTKLYLEELKNDKRR